jgi:hypothetical protein
MEREACGIQRRAAIVSEGTTHGATITADHLSFRVRTGFDVPCNRTHTTDGLFQCFLRMPIGCIDGFRSLA